MIKYYKCIKSYTNNEIGTIYSENDKPEWFKNYSSVKHFIEKSPIWNMYFEITECKLPEKWAVKVTPENSHVLTDWLKSKKDFDVSYLPVRGYVISEKGDGSYQKWSNTCSSYFTEISFEQFEKYVLKKEIPMKDNKQFAVGDVVFLPERRIGKFNNGCYESQDWSISDTIPLNIALVIERLDRGDLIFEGYRLTHAAEKFKPISELSNPYKVGDWVVFMPEVAKKLNLYTSVWNKPFVLKVDNITTISLLFNNSTMIKAGSNSPNSSNDYRCFRKATEDEIPKDVFSEKSEFKVGDWVYHTNNKQTYKITEINRGLFKAEFGHCCNTGSLDLRFCRKATKEEIAKVTQQIPVFMSYKEYPEYPLTPNECFKPKEKGDEWRYITGCDPSFEKPKQKEKLKLKRLNVKKI